MDRGYGRRALFVSAVSAATAPLRVWERLAYGARVRAVQLQPPLFILGHWRSGTTYLHNLLCADPALGHVTTFQAVAPELVFAGRLVRTLFAARMPRRRMGDGVPLAPDGPQEEEMALANLSPRSFYHHWSFPRRTGEYFERYVLFRGLAPGDLEQWQAAYLSILRKAALLAGGRRLVLKNPANTGRLRLLLQMFPDARFVHLHRDPYEVFASTRRFYREVYAISALQDLAPAALEANILDLYRGLLGQFLADRALVPPGRLVELPLQALRADPLGQVQEIYARLGLPGFAGAEPGLRAAVRAAAGHRPGGAGLDAAETRRVSAAWGFACAAWGYPLRP